MQLRGGHPRARTTPPEITAARADGRIRAHCHRARAARRDLVGHRLPRCHRDHLHADGGREVRVIDYLEATGQALPYYAKRCKSGPTCTPATICRMTPRRPSWGPGKSDLRAVPRHGRQAADHRPGAARHGRHPDGAECSWRGAGSTSAGARCCWTGWPRIARSGTRSGRCSRTSRTTTRRQPRAGRLSLPRGRSPGHRRRQHPARGQEPVRPDQPRAGGGQAPGGLAVDAVAMPTYQVACAQCGEDRWPTLPERPDEYICARCVAVGPEGSPKGRARRGKPPQRHPGRPGGVRKAPLGGKEGVDSPPPPPGPLGASGGQP